MIKRVFLLNGLAILAVVLNHAGGWGETAMFYWTNRYRPVSVPNFDQVGTLPYYILRLIMLPGAAAVPAFLFVAGFFVAYAARSSQPAVTWKMMRAKIWGLLPAYLIWSMALFVGDAIQGLRYSPIEYLARLILWGANGGLYFVPVLVTFYVLSPWLAPIAKTRWKLLLVVVAVIQLCTIGLRYYALLVGETPVVRLLINLTPDQLFLRWAFFFPFGLVAGLHIERLKIWLSHLKWGLLAAMILLALLTLLESEAFFLSTASHWRPGVSGISHNLLGVACILCFLAFSSTPIPFSNVVYELGKRSYGIYLLHFTVMEFVARVLRQVISWFLADQLLFVLVLIAIGLGVPLLFMTAVAGSPARRSYSYLFG